MPPKPGTRQDLTPLVSELERYLLEEKRRLSLLQQNLHTKDNDQDRSYSHRLPLPPEARSNFQNLAHQ